uniref:EB domain-containing protein n=1 Tax=Steinernema glaseri TaxID=37863 RepID=A0A1I8AG06_9BILA
MAFEFATPNLELSMWSEKPVGTLHDCTAMAYRGKAVGYRIHEGDDKMKCALLKEFVRFEALEDSGVRDYILTTNLDDDSCPATRNVTNFLSKPCDPEIGDCSLLEQIADYCRFVGSDIANCVSPKRTLKDVLCPFGQKRVDVKKGKRLCCPEGEKLAEERDGKALCCPEKKELKDVVDGKAICCAPSENHQKGTTLCCPSGQTYSKLEDTESCCPDGETLFKSSVGNFGCCPKEGCCGTKALKDHGICCWDERIAQRAPDGYSGCCDRDHTLYRDSSGEYRCCPLNLKVNHKTGECY